jgi:hypothetical protein
MAVVAAGWRTTGNGQRIAIKATTMVANMLKHMLTTMPRIINAGSNRMTRSQRPMIGAMPEESLK